jgi:protein ImuB
MKRRCCRPPSLLDALPPPARAIPPRAGPSAPATPAGRRFLALHLPWLEAERRRAAAPWASWETFGQRRQLRAVDRAAAAGLLPGQALADALAMLPELILEPADPAADAAWLRRLGLWAQAVTPLAALAPPDGLLLDITGVPHLHGGEPPLLAKVVARLARAGLTAQAAIAGTAQAAAALARLQHGAIIAAGEEAPALAPLPLAALRLPEAEAQGLHRLGLRRLGDLLRQPRAPFARRFPATRHLLDTALGIAPCPLQPLRPPPEFAAAREFLEPLVTREAIDAVLEQLLETLCRQLTAAGQGARRLVLLGYRVDSTRQGIAIGTGLPSRDPRHLARLFREKLERLAPGFGFERLALEARVTQAMAAVQSSLPAQDGISAEARHEALAGLLDRLAQRLPVWRLEPQASHWPERGVARRDAFAEILPAPLPLLPRPLRLLRRPLALQATALLPDGPPLLLRHGTRSWRVARAEGPERIEPEWWREERPSRDYYRVELASGARLWVCRGGAAPGAWWLHGRFE